MAYASAREHARAEARRRLGVVGPIRRTLERFSPDDNYERGGILVPSGTYGMDLIELPNHHPEPRLRYRAWMCDIEQQKRWNPRLLVVGYFHTHPGREAHPECWLPSDDDYATALVNGHLDHAVFHPATRKWTWYSAYKEIGRTTRTITVRMRLRRSRNSS